MLVLTSEEARILRPKRQKEKKWDNLRDHLITEIVSHHVEGILATAEIAKLHNVETSLVRSVFQMIEWLELGRRTSIGFQIRTVDHQEYADSVRLREVIEDWAVRRAAGRMPPERIALLRNTYHAPEEPHRGPMMMWRLDDIMHRTIGNAAGNAQVAANLVSLARTMRLFSAGRKFEEWHGIKREDQVVAEHLTILDALERGREYEVAQMIKHHIQGNAFVKLGTYIR